MADGTTMERDVAMGAQLFEIKERRLRKAEKACRAAEADMRRAMKAAQAAGNTYETAIEHARKAEDMLFSSLPGTPMRDPHRTDLARKLEVIQAPLEPLKAKMQQAMENVQRKRTVMLQTRAEAAQAQTARERASEVRDRLETEARIARRRREEHIQEETALESYVAARSAGMMRAHVHGGDS